MLRIAFQTCACLFGFAAGRSIVAFGLVENIYLAFAYAVAIGVLFNVLLLKVARWWVER